jgi:CubicO group peptidase (beta-lactamase class C family)
VNAQKRPLMKPFPNIAVLLVLLFCTGEVFCSTVRERLGLDSEKLKAVRTRMQSFVDDGTIAGAVTLLARHGEIANIDVVGLADIVGRKPMEEDSLFWIASMTKPITAVAVLMLQDEGKLSVEDPVEKHLPEFKGQWLVESQTNDLAQLKRAQRPINIRDLLTHTSGIDEMPAPRSNSTLAELVVGASQRPLRFAPGSKWSYSNAGINTLGRIVEVVSGEDFASFLERRIFKPLGMRDTTFWPNAAQAKRLARSYQPASDGKGLEEVGISFIQGPWGDRTRAPRPAGGLFSTARDYYRFCQMMLNGGAWNGKRLLSEAAVEMMTRTQTGEIKTGFTDGMSFGFGFAVVKEPKGITKNLAPGTFGHGGAYGTQAWVDPAKGMIFILMIQRAKLPNADASEVRRAFQEAAIEAMKD